MRMPDAPGLDLPAVMVIHAPTRILVATAPHTHIQVFDFKIRCVRFKI